MQTSEILIIQTAFIGDLLLCIPLLKRLRLTHSEAKLSIVVRAGLKSMLMQTGLVDEVYEIRKGDRGSYVSLKNQCQQKSFKKIFVVHKSLRSSLLAWQLPAQEKIAFSTWANKLLGFQCRDYDLNLPDALRQLSLLASEDAEVRSALDRFRDTKGMNHQLAHLLRAGEAGWVEEFASMGLSSVLDQARGSRSRFMEREGLQSQLGSNNVAIFPGSVWATKRWTLQGYVDLIKMLKEQGRQVFILGSAEEGELCSQIAKQTESVNLAGRLKLDETLLFLGKMNLVVSNDSGSMHLASVAEVPTVAIFGPTVLSIGYRPWQNKALVVQRSDLKCRPCGLHGHKKCPIGTHECMTGISARDVFQTIQFLESATRF